MQAANSLPVVVVGGGIGGLATALALSQKGFRVQVLEQAPVFKEIGAGIQLGPNVMRMFSILGITGDILPLAVFPTGLMIRDCITGEQVTCVPTGRPFEERFQYPYALIHRADLHAGLLGSCTRCPLIELKTSQKVTEIDDRGDVVRVATEQGQKYEAAAVVGADGLWSTVREMFVKDGKPRVSGHIAYRAVMPVSDFPERLRWQAMVIWCGEKTHLVHYPLRGGELFNLVAVFQSSRYQEGWDSYGDPAELNERYANTHSDVREVLSKIETWRMWVLHDREPIKQWSFGRVTLLGDAAHPTLQYMAQGAAMAIEDAVTLAHEVERSDGDFAAAFQRYQASRYLRTARIQIYSRLYGEVYHASGVLRELRNSILSAETPEQAYQGFSWIYDYQGPAGVD
jgi:3-hydroxybenzoate 6-monooxygenase